jgi:L-iditol 2-dehydrogenase
MKAVCKQKSGTFLQEISNTHEIASDYVRLKILYVGICKTDINVANGKIKTDSPLVIGHEASAEVVEVGGNINNIKVGDLVSIIPMSPCGNCDKCKNELFDLCGNSKFAGLQSSGYLREFVDLPERFLYSYKKTVSPLMVAYTEPVAAALAVLNFPELLRGKGLIVGKNRFSKLIDLILNKHKVTNILISESIPQKGRFDFVIETGLIEREINQLLPIIKKGGSLLIRSRSNYDLTFNARLLLEKQIRIQGVSYGRYEKAVAFIEKYESELMEFVGEVFDMKNFENAFSVSEEKTALKNFIKVG